MTLNYDSSMVEKFNKLIEGKVGWKILDILPQIKVAGEFAGKLTHEGALLLDPTGTFKEGIPLVPPEGDMGTGMVATNSVRQNTGNASFGTSSNTTIVTDKKMGIHRELDIIASPSGYPAALIHVNNCTTDINHWVNLFKEVIAIGNGNISTGDLYTALFNKALEGEYDAGGLMSVNYYSGEGIPQIYSGKPLFYRDADSELSLANFMRAHILSTLGTMKMGVSIIENEGIKINKIYGHGGFFKTPHVGSKALSSALNAPVVTLESAGEGGPYGMALLASYYLYKDPNESLEDYLDNKIFKNSKEVVDMASKEEIAGFNKFYKNYLKALNIEREALNE